jgi:hypothetical protein
MNRSGQARTEITHLTFIYLLCTISRLRVQVNKFFRYTVPRGPRKKLDGYED